MEKKTYTLNTLLAVVLGAALFVCVLVRTFAPRMILPVLDIPNMVLISLGALLLDHYLAPGAKRCYICIPVFSAITFGLLPFAACFVGAFLILLVSPMQALISIIIFCVIQFIETQFIYPHVVGGSVGLSPLLTLLAALVGGNVMGLFGIIFFIPLTAVVYTILREYVNAKLAERKIKIE